MNQLLRHNLYNAVCWWYDIWYFPNSGHWSWEALYCILRTSLHHTLLPSLLIIFHILLYIYNKLAHVFCFQYTKVNSSFFSLFCKAKRLTSTHIPFFSQPTLSVHIHVYPSHWHTHRSSFTHGEGNHLKPCVSQNSFLVQSYIEMVLEWERERWC